MELTKPNKKQQRTKAQENGNVEVDACNQQRQANARHLAAQVVGKVGVEQ